MPPRKRKSKPKKQNVKNVNKNKQAIQIVIDNSKKSVRKSGSGGERQRALPPPPVIIQQPTLGNFSHRPEPQLDTVLRRIQQLEGLAVRPAIDTTDRSIVKDAIATAAKARQLDKVIEEVEETTEDEFHTPEEQAKVEIPETEPIKQRNLNNFFGEEKQTPLIPTRAFTAPKRIWKEPEQGRVPPEALASASATATPVVDVEEARPALRRDLIRLEKMKQLASLEKLTQDELLERANEYGVRVGRKQRPRLMEEIVAEMMTTKGKK